MGQESQYWIQEARESIIGPSPFREKTLSDSTAKSRHRDDFLQWNLIWEVHSFVTLR